MNIPSSSRRMRRIRNWLLKILATLAALSGVVGLVWILFIVLSRGLPALCHLDFFIKLPTPPGMMGGGVGNAILGSFLVTLGATLFGVPIGLSAGVYLSEFGKDGKMSRVIRFCANVLMGMPSIIIGVFVYSFLVKPFGTYSGFAGAVALAIIIIPIVTRTTEDMLQLLPNALRESALALGIPRWRLVNAILFRSAKSGLVTGILLAIARVSGETAPLLFTTMNSPYWPIDFKGQVANLPVTIFNYAMSPYENWQNLAWGAACLILIGVLGVNLLARFFVHRKR